MFRFIFGFLILSASFAGATQEDLNSRLAFVNDQFAKILTTISNNFTQGQVELTRYAESEERVLAVRLNGFLRKTGVARTISINLDELSYDYGDGEAPKTIVKGGVKMDFTTFPGFSYKISDGIVDDIDGALQKLASQYLAEYGDAVQVSAAIVSNTKDEQNHYQSVQIKISLKIDLTRLPNSKKPSDIIFSSVDANIDLNFKTGLNVAAELVSNPTFIGFQQKQKGLKEFFTDLMDNNEIAWSQIKNSISDLNEALDRFANEN